MEAIYSDVDILPFLAGGQRPCGGPDHQRGAAGRGHIQQSLNAAEEEMAAVAMVMAAVMATRHQSTKSILGWVTLDKLLNGLQDGTLVGFL